MALPPVVQIKEAPTRTIGRAYALRQGDFLKLEGAPFPMHRKQIIISNEANNTKLHIMDPTWGTKWMPVFGNTSITLFTSAKIYLKAVDGNITLDGTANGSPGLFVLEVFYLP